MKRGATMFFVESMIFIFNLLLFSYQTYIEYGESAKIFKRARYSIKSIPFVVLFLNCCAFALRIPFGIICYAYDFDEPYATPTTYMLFIAGVHFYTLAWLWICRGWIKLCVTFFSKDQKIDYRKRGLVDRCVYGVAIVLTGFLVIIMLNYYIIPDLYDYEQITRFFDAISKILIIFVFTFYGMTLIRELRKSNKQLDIFIRMKMVMMLVLVNFMVPVLATLNILYIYKAKHKTPQDWFNLSFFFIEMMNSYSILVLFGRNPILAKMREMAGISDLIKKVHITPNTGESDFSMSRITKKSSNTNIGDSGVATNSSTMVIIQQTVENDQRGDNEGDDDDNTTKSVGVSDGADL
ncbi:hypothetical protein DFA_00436 [Cavenderia fasciculata]|uniref:THH1/TOM1/TOM3 domain-containing protein n=1 Tax=Cavenderia fasciculata TaxID=261658 RepID=F4PRS6_CACFS|nr:uncharacterized protein DFA_00436 [Cavenderia fasciculata]EGG20575.1 hypothetical protein DFA_00436 [Cavenderia fasciculata]|eukprot:XP_004358425.1 hypothetical protein DFA_00436 [Cavenderia fasciculata]